MTGALQNNGTIFGPDYAIGADGEVNGGVINNTAGKIIGPIQLSTVDLTNHGELTLKQYPTITEPETTGAPSDNQVRNYSQSASGVLRLAVNGTTTAGTDFSYLMVNGDAIIGGAIEVNLSSGFTATDGTVIPGVVQATGALSNNVTSVIDNSPEYELEAVTNGSAIDLVVRRAKGGTPLAVPTLNTWALAALAGLMALFGGATRRRQRRL